MVHGIGNPLPRNVRGEIRSKIHDGRTLNHSICDVIDNSIDAEATEIDIWIGEQQGCDWIADENKGYLLVIDNGTGIEESKLAQIIEFNTERDESYEDHELGSFGLGLKDALLAHGQEITVISKQKNKDIAMVRLSMQLSMEREDWTFVNNKELIDLRKGWGKGETKLNQWNTGTFSSAIETMESMEEGTIVILEFSHRPLEFQPNMAEEDELARISVVGSLKEWIGMTFADYLSGITLGNRTEDNPLIINLNGRPISSLDPFMSDQVGQGDFDGQQGTLKAIYEFDYFGLTCKFNQYILPNTPEREARYAGFDTRMKRATRLQLQGLQGIYVKRNGRLLDGPWNGLWRRSLMGMGPHHTTARWELVLPPESITFPELVPPDKSRVSLLGMLSEILDANRTRRRWHPQDAIPYDGTSCDDMQFNHRARERTDRNDIISTCNQNECAVRTLNTRYCDEHTVNRCQICQEVLEGDLCEACNDSLCNRDNCNNQRVNDSEYCIVCSQPECVAENCILLQQVVGNYCATHTHDVCNYPGGCNSLSLEGVLRCENHMQLELEGVEVTTILQGPLFEIGEGKLILNISHENFSRFINFIQGVR